MSYLYLNKINIKVITYLIIFSHNHQIQILKTFSKFLKILQQIYISVVILNI